MRLGVFPRRVPYPTGIPVHSSPSPAASLLGCGTDGTDSLEVQGAFLALIFDQSSRGARIFARHMRRARPLARLAVVGWQRRFASRRFWCVGCRNGESLAGWTCSLARSRPRWQYRPRPSSRPRTHVRGWVAASSLCENGMPSGAAISTRQHTAGFGDTFLFAAGGQPTKPGAIARIFAASQRVAAS